MLVDEREHAVDEGLALQIADVAQRDAAAEVIVAVGIAARTAERAFARDFDREVRSITEQDLAPSANNTLHEFSFIVIARRG